jgi:hypothetical protein
MAVYKFYGGRTAPSLATILHTNNFRIEIEEMTPLMEEI